MVRKAERDQEGDLGESQVSTAFTSLGWGPIKNDTHDLGTDIYVQTRDDKLSDRGLLLAVQVKAGKSRFDNPQQDASKEVVGWWFDSDYRHFDDWVRHGLPHVLVLNDNEKNIGYWVHVTPDSVQSTGSTCKILVPRSQVVADSSRERLLDVAATQRRGFDLEGSIWRQNAQHLPSPAAMLRHALIAPRLVAPHPNEEIDGLFAPEQALAMLIRGRWFEFERELEKEIALPSLEKMKRRKWAWKLVAAFWDHVVSNTEIPERLIASASKPHMRAAIVVVRVCWLAEHERHQEAVALISDNVESLDGVDRSWLLMQRAWHRLEFGQILEAREDAALAQRILVGEAFDVTASAVNASAADLLFRTAREYTTSSIGSVLRSTDTATSWWRSQTLQSGSEAALDEYFKQWADVRSVTWGAEDKAATKFHSALFTAQYSADSSEWRSSERLRSRHELLAGHEMEDNSRIFEGLNGLRRCGDNKSVESAARRIWRIGPLEPLADAVEVAAGSIWTRTSALPSLVLVRCSADLLPESMNLQLVKALLGILGDDYESFVRRCLPRFAVEHHVLRAVTACVNAGRNSDVHEAAAVYLLSNANRHPHHAGQDDLIRLAQALDASLLQVDTSAQLFQACKGRSSRVKLAILGRIREVNSEAAKKLQRIARSGDSSFALGQFGDLRRLGDAGARKNLERCVKIMQSISDEAKQFSFRGGAPDEPRTVAILNCLYPKVADWESLLEFLADQAVPGEYKRGACQVLARLAEKIPQEQRPMLSDIANTLSDETYSLSFLEEPLGAAGVELLLALGAVDEDRMTRVLVSALTGGWRERRDICAALSHVNRPESWGVLGALASDSHVDVRTSAAMAITAKAMRETSSLADALMQKLIDDGGVLIPLKVANMLNSNIETGSSATIEKYAAMLVAHRSSAVRGLALKARSDVGARV